MKRTTNKMVEGLAEAINDITGNPQEPYTRKDGRTVANVGCFHISYQCGGVNLHQISNKSGGVRDVLSCGHISRGDLYARAYAYLSALRDIQCRAVAVKS
jgi:hypothetical protein